MVADLQPREAGSAWCQRWGPDRKASWRHRRDGGFDASRYAAEEIPDPDAKAWICGHHYSGTYPAALRRYGLLDIGGPAGPQLAGVAVLSVPASRQVLTAVFPGLEPYAQSAELGRLVLAPSVAANGESWFLAEVFRMAARRGLRGIVSFSDPVARYAADGTMTMPGHIGIIYQASNALCLGRSCPRTHWVLPGGQVLSPRALQKIRGGEPGHEYATAQLIAAGAPVPRACQDRSAWLAAALAAAGARRMRHPGCIRYAFRLGETRRQRAAVAIALPAGPYPKSEVLVRMPPPGWRPGGSSGRPGGEWPALVPGTA